MFKQYRRTNIAEMQPFKPAESCSVADELQYLQNLGVSVSQADILNGSPREGDMIARNPLNHNDMWLVAKQYFEDNFEEIIK